jgi:hypothetical protein
MGHEPCQVDRAASAALPRANGAKASGEAAEYVSDPWSGPSMTAWDERKDLLASICYVLVYRLNGKPLSKAMSCPEPDIAAERVLAHLERSA